MFLQLCCVDRPEEGGLSPYVFALMVIFFLQQRKEPFLPVYLGSWVCELICWIVWMRHQSLVVVYNLSALCYSEQAISEPFLQELRMWIHHRSMATLNFSMPSCKAAFHNPSHWSKCSVAPSVNKESWALNNAFCNNLLPHFFQPFFQTLENSIHIATSRNNDLEFDI